MASYKAKFEWQQNTEDFKLMKALRDALTTSKEKEASKIENFKCELDIIEDFSYETKSSFENIGDNLASTNSFISSGISLLQTAGNITSLVGGKESPFQRFLKLQSWKETEPFRMSFQFNLNTKTDPFVDVYAPAMALLSMSILSVDKKENFHTPGINFKNISAVQQIGSGQGNKPTEKAKPNPNEGDSKDGKSPSGGDAELTNVANSKIIKKFSIITSTISGVSAGELDAGAASSPNEIAMLTVNGCFIESCKPTWSKERTASGIPLWCNLDVTIQSIFSANDGMFNIIKPRTGGVGVTALGGTAVVATNIFR